MNTKMENMLVGLDDDERAILPELYMQDPSLYSHICGVAYIITTEDPDSGLDWVWENNLEKTERELNKRKIKYEVLAKIYIARLKLPWTSGKHNEYLIDQEELHKNRKKYRILDVYLRVQRKSDGKIFSVMDPLEFESNRDKYDVLEIRYLVNILFPEEVKERFLNIPGDRFHTIIAE